MRYLLHSNSKYIPELRDIFESHEMDNIIGHINKTTHEYESLFIDADYSGDNPSMKLYILTKTKILEISIDHVGISTRSILTKDITSFIWKQTFCPYTTSAIIKHRDGDIIFTDFICDYEEKRRFLNRLEELR